MNGAVIIGYWILDFYMWVLCAILQFAGFRLDVFFPVFWPYC